MKNTLDDIVFENRNKDYGAYSLRRSYHRNMVLGIGSAFFLFACVLGLPLFYRFFKGTRTGSLPMLEVKEIILQKAPPIDPKKDIHLPIKMSKQINTEKLKIIHPEVKKDIEVEEQSLQSEKKIFKPAKTDSNQHKIQNSTLASTVVYNGTESYVSASISEGKEAGEIYEIAEEAPRFPGCEQYPDLKDKELCAYQKLTQYLSRNIMYPDQASKSGIQGRCVIAFIIEIDGKISDARITQDIGEGCGEEALRVVNSMNLMKELWRPGRQHGNPVRVKFNLPVNFRIISKI